MAIPLPGPSEVPPGPVRDFLVTVHELYDQAGQPAARLISRDIANLPHDFESVSHQTISATLRGDTLPTWEKVRSILTALGQRTDVGLDPQALERQFRPLWMAARAAPASEHTQRTTAPAQRPPDELRRPRRVTGQAPILEVVGGSGGPARGGRQESLFDVFLS